MFRRLLGKLRAKDPVQVLDRLVTVAMGAPGNGGERGMRMPDGSPVPVEKIMEQFGVDRARAEEIAARNTR